MNGARKSLGAVAKNLGGKLSRASSFAPKGIQSKPKQAERIKTKTAVTPLLSRRKSLPYVHSGVRSAFYYSAPCGVESQVPLGYAVLMLALRGMHARHFRPKI